MGLYRKILFPTDYSEASVTTAPFVKEMARHCGAELIVLHTLPLYPMPEAGGDFLGAVPMMPMPAELRKGEGERLAFFCGKHFPGMPVTQRLADGEAAVEIEDCAAAEGVDLVMMPTHGAGAVRRWLLGSVAAKVLHDIGCAVWTGVPAHYPEEVPEAGYASIVCALAGNDEEDETVARTAGELAKAFGSRLTLTHVVEPPQVTWDFDFSPYREKLMTAAEERLLALDKKLGLEAGVRVESDMIPRGIHSICEDEKADLLVLGRGHARQGFGRIWSQLYETIREAPCPVLSV
jgi:nucleotide-binding universal stress UspA family protein